MRFRLLRRRLTISAPRVAIRSALPWPVRWLALAVVLGFCAAVALWAFEFGKSIAGLDTAGIALQIICATPVMFGYAWEAPRAADWAATAGVAHRLKSASRSVGALQLGELCAELEDHCRKGGPTLPAEMVARFAAALRAALDASAAASLEGDCS